MKQKENRYKWNKSIQHNANEITQKMGKMTQKKTAKKETKENGKKEKMKKITT